MMLPKRYLAWAVPAVAGMFLVAIGLPAIVHAQSLSITTSTLPAAEEGVAYSETLAASGGTSPYTWSISAGSLPAGLSLDGSTGVISGTPTATGTSSFTVKVTDSSSPTPATATAALSITVAAPLSVSTTTLAEGEMGVTYLQTLATTDGNPPDTWSITAGALPAGLSLDSTSGSISGTPTAAGSSNFTVQAMDASGGTATKALSITIVAPLSVSTSTLPAGVVGTSYSETLAASGGTSPYTWSISAGSLPAGLSLDGSTGVISGTPTATGTSSFTVKVTDSSSPTPATATAALSITVAAQTQAPAFTSLASATFDVGQAGSFTITATGSPTPSIIESGGLPGGVTFTANGNGSATLAGTPASGSAGTYHLTFTASNGVAPNATQSFTLTVLNVPAPVPSGAAMTDLDNLAAAVQGVGPGRSLTAKVRAAERDLTFGNARAACGVLHGFTHEVMAQSGKKISPSVASTLLTDAQQASTALGCGNAPLAESQAEVEHPQAQQPLATFAEFRQSDVQSRCGTENRD